MKFEVGYSQSGLRISMSAEDAAVLGQTVRVVSGVHGITIGPGSGVGFSTQPKRPDRKWLVLSPCNPGLVWVPDYYFAQMVLEYEEIGRNEFILRWPDPALCKAPRATSRGIGNMTREYAREFLFELVCEGNASVYDNLTNNSAEVVDALKSLTQKRT